MSHRFLCLQRLLLPLLLLLPLHGRAGGAVPFPYRSTLLSTSMGLAANRVNEVLQDERGYIWMATSNGLCRYDGSAFVCYGLQSGDPGLVADPHIAVMSMDTCHHLLWVRTAVSNVACYDLRRGRFVDYTGRGEPARAYAKWLLARDGSLWLYHSEHGVRHVRVGREGFTTTDYTRQNSGLKTHQANNIVEDSLGNVWLGTTRGVLRVGADGRSTLLLADCNIVASAVADGRTLLFVSRDGRVACLDSDGTQRYVKFSDPLLSASAGRITCSLVWHGEWMLFTDGPTLAIDPATGQCRLSPELQVRGAHVQGSTGGCHFLADDEEALWMLCPDGGVVRQSLIRHQGLVRLSISGRPYHVAQGADGRFFVATRGNGLFVLSPEGQVERHVLPGDGTGLLPTEMLQNVYVDRTGCIWLPTDEVGVCCLKPTLGVSVERLRPDASRQGERTNMIHALALTSQGQLACSFGRDWLQVFGHDLQPQTRATQQPNVVRAMIIGPNDRQWLGTLDGLYLDGQQVGDALTPGRRLRVNAMVEDARGRVWAGCWNDGLLVFAKQEGEWRCVARLMQGSANELRIRNMQLRPDGRLWIASHNGLYCIDTKKERLEEKDFLVYNPEHGNFPYKELLCVYAATDGCLWVCARGGDLTCCRPDGQGFTFTTYSAQHGIGLNDVVSVTEDSLHRIWAGCSDGVVSIDPATGQVDNRQLSANVLENACRECCALTLPDGRIVFGTLDGMAVVTPLDDTSSRAEKGALAITDVRVNGTSLIAETDTTDDDLAASLLTGGALRLPHHRNTLTICFSTLNFARNESTVYQYYMEGVDREWGSTLTNHDVTYANLKPGKYVFHVRTMLSDQQWDEQQLRIEVLQPWWYTWWAWTLWLLMAAVAAYHLFANARERFRMRQQIQMERERNEFRAQFFTNIAHEFRTPLAIIQGAVEKISDSKGGAPSKDTLQTLKRGTGRMSRLVNMFLEYRKISTGNRRLRVSQGDLVTFVRNIHTDFWPVAERKDIRFTFSSEERRLEMPFDHSAVETIVYNLLGNALKYTPQHGTVALEIRLSAGRQPSGQALEDATRWVKLVVTDNGPGISAEQRRQLFKPFMHGFASQGGMGIGLYSAHQLAQSHKGSLTYQETVGGGATFTLTLPADSTPYEPADYLPEGATRGLRDLANSNIGREQMVQQVLPPAMNEDITVAVVEDDADLLQQLKTELSAYFKVDAYMDGREALEGLTSSPPSLVLSDVMLPDTNGFDLVRQLRAQASTARIPVIMLTALSDDEHQIRAYKAGADDYMVKPCNFQLLLLRITQLIKWYAQPPASVGAVEGDRAADAARGTSGQAPDADGAQETAGTPMGVAEPGRPVITNIVDKRLLERMQMQVVAHLGEEDFGVNELAEALRMGRTKLFGKTRELLGITPNKYIQNERLRAAEALLLEGELNISEVAYKVGFADNAYFSKLFRQTYGVSPGQYRKGARR